MTLPEITTDSTQISLQDLTTDVSSKFNWLTLESKNDFRNNIHYLMKS
jgi:hypothetical protein